MLVNKSMVASLARNPLFSSFPVGVLEDIITESYLVHGTRGQELFAAGDAAQVFFFVISGWVKLYRINREGEEAVIHVIAAGETFAEAAVFGSLQKYPVNAQYVEDSALLAMPRAAFINKIATSPELALYILGAISARQRYLIQQIEQLTVKNAPQRIGIFLLKLCLHTESSHELIVELPYDKMLISRRLNIQPETFSRALKKLDIHGVHADGHKIFIRDVESLARFCEVDDRFALC